MAAQSDDGRTGWQQFPGQHCSAGRDDVRAPIFIDIDIGVGLRYCDSQWIN